MVNSGDQSSFTVRVKGQVVVMAKRGGWLGFLHGEDVVCFRIGKEPKLEKQVRYQSMQFFHKGNRIRPTQTGLQFKLMVGSEIDAIMHQSGGSPSHWDIDLYTHY